MNIIQNKTELTLISLETSYFKFIHIIQQITTSGNIIVKSTITDSVSTFELINDGYYKIIEIKLPGIMMDGYYTTNHKVFNSLGVELTIQDLLLVDPSTSNIEKNEQDILSIENINDYYIKLIRDKFLKNINGCSCSFHEKLNIDTLTMGIALINNLKIYSQYYEIQRIVEQLSICAGITLPNCNCHD